MAVSIPKTKYTLHIDVLLLREVVNHNPFADPQQWKTIVDALQDVGEGGPTTARSVRERVHLLMEYFKKDQMSKINKSGTDEEYTEREALMQDIVDMHNDRENIARTKKNTTPAMKTDIRKRAMETLKNMTNDKADSDEDQSEKDLVSPAKRMRMTPSMAKKDMIVYLEKKNEKIAAHKDEEIRMRKEELEVTKKKIDQEQREKDARMQAEQKRQDAELALRREEFELSKARFELERKEREARLESDKKEKDLMLALLSNLLDQNKK